MLGPKLCNCSLENLKNLFLMDLFVGGKTEIAGGSLGFDLALLLIESNFSLIKQTLRVSKSECAGVQS